MFKHNFKKLFLLLFFVVLLGVFFLFYLTPALAQPPQQGINEFLNETNLKAVSLPQAIGRIVRIVLTFLGLIAVVIMIVGGFIWMTSGGQSDKIEKAKKIMLAGLVGLLIIVLAYAIANFILSMLMDLNRSNGPRSFGPGGQGYLPDGANYLVITSKYPKLGDMVPQNTTLVVSFNHSLDCETVKLCTGLNQPNGCTVSIKSGGSYKTGILKAIGNTLVFKPDHICPPPLSALGCQGSSSCGSPQPPCVVGTNNQPTCENMPDHNPPYTSTACCRTGAFCCNCFEAGRYDIEITGGANGLKAINGKFLKDNLVSWYFNSTNVIDNVPPEVIVNLPQPGSIVAMNTGVAVIFSKPIDPTTLVVGEVDANGILLNPAQATVLVKDNTTNKYIAGHFERLSTNAFLFRPDQRCAQPNEQCYCFGPQVNIGVSLKNDVPPGAGIRDTHCNLLSCDNGKCNWNFSTSNVVDTQPPEVKFVPQDYGQNYQNKEKKNPPDIAQVQPLKDATDVDRATNVLVTFFDRPIDGGMDPTSINYDTLQLSSSIARDITTADSKTFTYQPYSVLDAFQNYGAVVFGGDLPNGACGVDPEFIYGARDLAGNPMAFSYYQWPFTTGGLVNGGKPYISWVSPTQGPEGQCVTIHGYNLGCATGWPIAQDAQTGIWNYQNNTCRAANKPVEVEGDTAFYNGNGSGPWTGVAAGILRWDELNRPSPLPHQYSPENELVVTVPNGATSFPNLKEIRVTPAH